MWLRMDDVSKDKEPEAMAKSLESLTELAKKVAGKDKYKLGDLRSPSLPTSRTPTSRTPSSRPPSRRPSCSLARSLARAFPL